MASKQTGNKPVLPGYRFIMRGHDKAGTYKRAVRTVHAPNPDAAANYVAENGEKLAKDAGFKVEFTNLFAPLEPVNSARQ